MESSVCSVGATVDNESSSLTNLLSNDHFFPTMSLEPYELNPIKRRRLETALKGRTDALTPGRMDNLEDFYLEQAIRESTEDSDEQEQQRADELILLTSTVMKPILQTHILPFLSIPALFAVASVDSNLNHVVETYAERPYLEISATVDDRYERFFQIISQPRNIRARPLHFWRNKYRRMRQRAKQIAKLRTNSEAQQLPYRCLLYIANEQWKLMTKLHESDWDGLVS